MVNRVPDEKSFFLATLVGWYEEKDSSKWPENVRESSMDADSWWNLGSGRWHLFLPDLYHEIHMHLAWEVHLWALSDPDIGSEYSLFWADRPRPVWMAENAHEKWLDEILRIASKK